MFEIGNGSSILELGFSTNLVGVSLYAASRLAKIGVLAPVIATMKAANPALTITRRDAAYLHQTVAQFLPVLGKLERVAWGAVGTSIILAGFAVYGLLLCATAPTTNLPAYAAWLYAVTALVIMPAVYLGIGMIFTWSKDMIASEIEEHPPFRAAIADYFDVLLERRRRLEKMDQEFNEALADFPGAGGLSEDYAHRRMLDERRHSMTALLSELTKRIRERDSG